MKTKEKPSRLYEYKIVYSRPGWEENGEHYYMCETADIAVSNHAVVSEQHGRGLTILNVYKKNPYTNTWEDETTSVIDDIQKYNEQ